MSVVLKDFVCKKTKRLFKAGELYNGDRTEELQKLGYVSVDEGTQESTKPRKRIKRDDSG